MSNLTSASLKLTQVLVDPKTMTCARVLQVCQKGLIEIPRTMLRTIMPFRQACGAPAQVMVLVSTVHSKYQDLHVKSQNVLKLSKTTTN